jgi:chemotaxis protein CheC
MNFPFSDVQTETLKELINIGVGKGGDILNQMLSAHITLDVPEISIIDEQSFLEFLEKPEDPLLSAVNMEFDGSMAGTVNLMFRAGDADKMARLLVGEDVIVDGMEMTDLRSGTLIEVGNVVINGVIGTLSNILHMHLNYSVPSYLEGNIGQIIRRMEREINSAVLIVAKTRFHSVSLDLEGDLIFFLTIESFEALLESFDNLHT